jgi:hypothetical protein
MRKISKILKYLDQQEKIKIKLKRLVEEEEEESGFYKNIILTSLESKKGVLKSLERSEMTVKAYLQENSDKENISPNMKIEYSFSPNLLIKHISNSHMLESPHGKKEVVSFNRAETQKTLNICGILDRLFKKENEEDKKSAESLGKDSLTDRSHYFIKKEEEDSQGNYSEYEVDFLQGQREKRLPEESQLKSSLYPIRTRSSRRAIENMFDIDKIFFIEKNNVKENVNDPSKNISEKANPEQIKEAFAAREIQKKFENNLYYSMIKKTQENEVMSTSKKSDYSCLLSNISRNSRQGMKYKMYSKAEKKFCLDLINNQGKDLKDVSEMCEVPLKSLKRWLDVGYDRKKGCGRKVKDPYLEKKLLDWYNQRASSGKLPSPREMSKTALKITTNSDFLASKGWLEKFRKKHNLLLNSRRHFPVAKFGINSPATIKEI